MLASKDNVTGNDTLVHVLTNINISDGGNYICFLDSLQLFDANDTITLEIYPYFTDKTVDLQVPQSNGSTFNVTCEADGFPAPNMTLLDFNSDILAITSSNTLTYEFVAFQFGQEGQYQCIATSLIQFIQYNFTIVCKYYFMVL